MCWVEGERKEDDSKVLELRNGTLFFLSIYIYTWESPKFLPCILLLNILFSLLDLIQNHYIVRLTL